MNREQLLQKLNAMLDEAERTETFGSIEIELRNGKVLLVRTIKTELINGREGDRTHAKRETRFG